MKRFARPLVRYRKKRNPTRVPINQDVSMFNRNTTKAACLFLFVFLMIAGSVQAQGTLTQSDVRSTPGPVVPGATVTICTSTASLTVLPCFPLATIYTNAAMTVQSVNPLTADGNGNYSYYAPAGTYVVSITGRGLPGRSYTVVLPCVPNSPTGISCGGSSGGTGLPAGPAGTIQSTDGLGNFTASIFNQPSGTIGSPAWSVMNLA